jgi:uncharacterized protein
VELPTFRYHPDPVDTGSIELVAVLCAACGENRPAAYTGPVYAEEELDGQLCPWCIADGSAHEKFDAEFTDAASVGLGWEPVPKQVIEEVAFRTPGFSGWQQERWYTHCADAAVFLGQADGNDLSGKWAAAVPAMRADLALSDADWVHLLEHLAKGRTGSPTAYVFECLHCGQLGGYWDSH